MKQTIPRIPSSYRAKDLNAHLHFSPQTIVIQPRAPKNIQILFTDIYCGGDEFSGSIVFSLVLPLSCTNNMFRSLHICVIYVSMVRFAFGFSNVGLWALDDWSMRPNCHHQTWYFPVANYTHRSWCLRPKCKIHEFKLNYWEYTHREKFNICLATE